MRIWEWHIRTHYHDLSKMGILTGLLFMRSKRNFKLPSKPVVFFFFFLSNYLYRTFDHLNGFYWANLFSIDSCFTTHPEISVCSLCSILGGKMNGV